MGGAARWAGVQGAAGGAGPQEQGVPVSEAEEERRGSGQRARAATGSVDLGGSQRRPALHPFSFRYIMRVPVVSGLRGVSNKSQTTWPRVQIHGRSRGNTD